MLMSLIVPLTRSNVFRRLRTPSTITSGSLKTWGRTLQDEQDEHDEQDTQDMQDERVN